VEPISDNALHRFDMADFDHVTRRLN